MPLRIFFLLLFLFTKTGYSGEKTWIIFNNIYKGSISLEIYDGTPCLTRPLLQEWGVRVAVLEKLEWDGYACLKPQTAKLFSLQYWFHPDAHLLTLLFPDEAIHPQQYGISTSRWNDGINAFFVNYRLDANNQQARYWGDTSGTDFQLDVDNGINMGPWRLRHQNTFWRDKNGLQGSFAGNTSFWQNITSLRSRLTLGDGNTNGSLFNSIPMRGLSLASNESMYPDSWRPYVPVINGYARTEAEVTIHQNGERVYRVRVPPGPFTLHDFYPSDIDGNLELTIKESDGTERTRQLPYTIMPNMVGKGYFSYELAAGRYHPFHLDEKESVKIWQGTLSSGVAANLTVFGGIQQSENYHSEVIGLGGNMGAIGAASVDVTLSDYTQKHKKFHGSVWRLRYAKTFFRSETSLNAQFQWFPTGSRYRSLQERLEQLQWMKFGLDDETTERRLSGQVALTQNFGSDSSLNLSWQWLKSHQSIHDKNAISLSIDTRLNDLDLSFYAGSERRGDKNTENVMGINVSIPIDVAGYNSNIALISDHSNSDKNRHAVDVYGSALDDFSLRYDATLGHTEHGDDSLMTSLGYQYNAGEVNFSLNRSGKQKDYHADVSGSVVLYDDGVVFGQTLGNTSALIEVPDKSGIAFYNQFSSTTNSQGKLLVSYLTPWRLNRVTVDSFSLPESMQLDVEEMETVPTEGAIIKLDFPVNNSHETF